MSISKITPIIFIAVCLFLFTNCASGYKLINPPALNYNSGNDTEGVSMRYKYDLLDKKYAKKEVKKDIKLVAISITNNSNRDLTFGKDLRLTYENGNSVKVL